LNRILETSTSTGTGDFTLLGALNSPAEGINGTLPFSARVPLKLYVPYMIEDTASGLWEKGKGFLSASNTLVRGYVLDGSNGANKVNFTAGTKKVYFPTENRAFGADYYNNTVWKNTMANIGYRGSMTMVAGTLYLTPHLQLTSQRITSVGIKVTSGLASARVKIILYNFVRQADTADYNSSFPIAFEIGEVAGVTATDKIITTDFYLPEGAYMVGVVSTHAIQVVANSTVNVFNPLYWETLCGDTVCTLDQTGVNIDAIPQTTFGALSRRTNAASPCVGFRGNCL
jgi:hypothetical protein